MTKEALELAKQIAEAVWSKYDDSHGYRTEKIKRNQSFDDMLPVWQQFDPINQREFEDRLRKYLDECYLPALEIKKWIEDYKRVIKI